MKLKFPGQLVIVVWVVLVTGFNVHAQIPIVKSEAFTSKVPNGIQLRIIEALDTLIRHVYTNRLIAAEIDSTGASLTKTMFGTIKGTGIYGNAKNDSLYSPRLIELYAAGRDQYFASLAYIGNNTLKAVVNIKATVYTDRISFSIPLFYLTRNWKIKKAGRVTYHYADHLNLRRAVLFNKKNTLISGKLGLPPENFDFYLADNYFEILRLLGYAFDSETAGHENDGFGPADGYIFSVMHNEDFSHDLFHYYAEKVRTHSRNSAAEEGIAYSWGNAYYTDEQGETITQGRLVMLLKQYLLKNPGSSLLELFNKNPPVFPSNTRVRSLLASLVSDEVERRKGIAGIKALIDCGSGDDNYFKAVNQLIDINTANFNIAVSRLLESYKPH